MRNLLWGSRSADLWLTDFGVWGGTGPGGVVVQPQELR